METFGKGKLLTPKKVTCITSYNILESLEGFVVHQCASSQRWKRGRQARTGFHGFSHCCLRKATSFLHTVFPHQEKIINHQMEGDILASLSRNHHKSPINLPPLRHECKQFTQQTPTTTRRNDDQSNEKSPETWPAFCWKWKNLRVRSFRVRSFRVVGEFSTIFFVGIKNFPQKIYPKNNQRSFPFIEIWKMKKPFPLGMENIQLNRWTGFFRSCRLALTLKE